MTNYRRNIIALLLGAVLLLAIIAIGSDRIQGLFNPPTCDYVDGTGRHAQLPCYGEDAPAGYK